MLSSGGPKPKVDASFLSVCLLFLFLNVIFDCIIEEFACKELLIWATLMK